MVTILYCCICKQTNPISSPQVSGIADASDKFTLCYLIMRRTFFFLKKKKKKILNIALHFCVFTGGISVFN